MSNLEYDTNVDSTFLTHPGSGDTKRDVLKLKLFVSEGVFAAHVLAKTKIFDEIMEKFQFSYLSQKLMI